MVEPHSQRSLCGRAPGDRNMTRKGIILAGGSGSRLYPLTRVVNKQLLPVYDKPMVYYPLSTLMLAGIRDILVISTPRDLPQFERLLGSGDDWGLSFQYVAQPVPDGIARAFALGREFIGRDPVTLVLGDNILFGQGLSGILEEAGRRGTGATVFGYRVRDPERYGVAELDAEGRVIGIEEKPARPRSPYAVTGLYFYDNQVVDIAAGLEPSPRGEYEITEVNVEYLKRNQLSIELLGRGMAWLDTGTHEALQQASSFIEAIERRQGLKVASPEELAFRLGFIAAEGLARLAEPLKHSPYGRYLLELLETGPRRW
jgi:glucose-1-phosphate thymidylyltransferase